MFHSNYKTAVEILDQHKLKTLSKLFKGTIEKRENILETGRAFHPLSKDSCECEGFHTNEKCSRLYSPRFFVLEKVTLHQCLHPTLKKTSHYFTFSSFMRTARDNRNMFEGFYLIHCRVISLTSLRFLK